MHAPSLLVVSYHYLPRITPGSLRVASLARYLRASGWEVTVLTSAPTTPGLDGVRVVSTQRRPHGDHRGYAARRLHGLWKGIAFPDVHVGWSIALVSSLAQLLERRPVDAVLTSSPPHSSQVAVAAVRRRRRFVWVADYRDPWTAPSRQPRGPLSRAAHRALERRSLEAADLVLANTPGNRAELLHAFPSLAPERVAVVTNGFDDSMLDAAPAPPAETNDLTYVGEVYPGMLGRYLEAVARLYRESPALAPRLSVYGEVDPREWQLVRGHGLAELVERRGFVSHDESLAAMRQARALLLLLPQQESWRTCVPSKTYPYLASGRRVLALVPEGDAAVLVRESPANVVLGGSDPAVNAAAIARFVREVRAGAGASGAVPAGVRDYSYSAIVRRLDGLLRGALRGADG